MFLMNTKSTRVTFHDKMKPLEEEKTYELTFKIFLPVLVLPDPYPQYFSDP